MKLFAPENTCMLSDDLVDAFWRSFWQGRKAQSYGRTAQ